MQMDRFFQEGIKELYLSHNRILLVSRVLIPSFGGDWGGFFGILNPPPPPAVAGQALPGGDYKKLEQFHIQNSYYPHLAGNFNNFIIRIISLPLHRYKQCDSHVAFSQI